MKKLIIFITIFWAAAVILAQQDPKKSHALEPLTCTTCHSCEIPTKDNPCLKSCPRDHMITMEHLPEEGPDMITMDAMKEISDLYAPVIFSHQLHAEMSAMSGGCAMCHHYNPPGRVVPCSDCHESTRKRADISKPDLKGAYHRQCIDCHRTWSASVKCADCHVLNKELKGEDLQVKTARETRERVHPEIKEPTRLVYETDFDEGKIVTFYHNEHVEIYGFECADCHQNESCAKCHMARTTTASEEASFEEAHDFCSGCHVVDDDCGYCHKDNILPPFDHARRTGFDLGKYHQRFSCTQCHGANKKFTGLSSNCNSCHGGWSSETFNHKITGLTLSENHIDFDCEVCHIDRNFVKKPACDGCHEEDVTYPDYIPGEKE